MEVLNIMIAIILIGSALATGLMYWGYLLGKNEVSNN